MATQVQERNETASRIQRIRETVAEARNQGQTASQPHDALIEIPFSELEWIRD
jgi:hypothetical protein